RVVGRQEADERDDEQARIEALGAVEADEGVELGVEALAEHLLVDLRPDAAPAVDGPGAAEALDRLHAAVEGDPRHHLRVREMAPRAADLPDALVGSFQACSRWRRTCRWSAHASGELSRSWTRPWCRASMTSP